MYMDAERMMMQRRIDNLMEQLELVKRQRDAAIKDLAVIKFCHTCKFDKYSVHESDICYSCVNKCYWEWRGLCKENGGTE